MAQTPSKDVNQRSSTQHPEQNQYPLQQVIQFEGGYKIVIGNETGKQFVATWHPSGSHTIMHPDGSISEWKVGDHRVHGKGGLSISVDENNDVKVGGHNKLAVQGGGQVEISGDCNLVVGGSVQLAALGGLGAAVKGNMYLACDGAANFNAKSFNFKGGEFEVSAQMNLNGNIEHKGDINTSGTHFDAIGYHDA